MLRRGETCWDLLCVQRKLNCVLKFKKNINAKQLGKRMGSFTSAPAFIYLGTGKRETYLKYKKMLLPCCMLSSGKQWEGKRPMAAMWEVQAGPSLCMELHEVSLSLWVVA